VTRSVLAIACGALLGLAAPAPAAILAPDDAAELANALAEATAEQQVCYGWSFQVADFGSGAEDGPEVGSNLGPGRAVDPSQCRRFVVLSGGITYTSDASEQEDSAVWSIESNLERPPRIRQLEALGYSANDLLGDDNDLTIINATGALPALVAEQRDVGAVPFETARREPGVSGEPTGEQGSDFLRQNGEALILFALMLAGGLFWLYRLQRQARRARRRKTSSPRPAET
jgi:hypothetical protein